MALHLPLIGTLVGADFPNGYARIVTIAAARRRGGGHSIMIDVSVYAQAPASEDVRQVDFKRYHTPFNTLPAGANLLAQGYAWLKLQPEFAVATDD